MRTPERPHTRLQSKTLLAARQDSHDLPIQNANANANANADAASNAVAPSPFQSHPHESTHLGFISPSHPPYPQNTPNIQGNIKTRIIAL